MNTQEIHDLAQELLDLRSKKKEAEEEVKDINARIKDLEENKLHNLLTDDGVNSITIDDLDIKHSLVYRGSYTKHSDKEAFKFLFDTNNDGALKQYLMVDLTACPGIESYCQAMDIPYKVEYSIHHATLSSILKELIEFGLFTTEDIEKYSVYIQPQVKVKQI